jgi:hypothetical protein
LPPDDIQFTLESEIVLDGWRPTHKDLPDDRLTGFGRVTKIQVIRWHTAPPENLQAFLHDEVFKAFFTRMALVPLRWQKDHAYAVLAWLWQLNADAVTGVLEKFVWHLEQNACSVTGVLFTATCTTVVEILKDGEGLLDELVRLSPFDIHDEPDATGVMLEFGIIQALFGGKASAFHGCPSLVLPHNIPAMEAFVYFQYVLSDAWDTEDM